MPTAAGSGDRTDRFQSLPESRLRHHVVEYWGMSRDLAAMGGFTITPDRHGELICCADDLYAIEAGDRHKLPSVFLLGLLDAPLRIEADGVIRCLSARLQPWSLGPFAATRIGDGRWLDGSRLFEGQSASMCEALRRGQWHQAAEGFDRVLGDLFATHTIPALAIEMVKALVADERPLPVDLAAETDLSRRSLERRVRSMTQRSPGQLVGLSRFQRVRDALWSDPAQDLAGLAADTGYADQPHMTREFRRYAGTTPKRFALQCRAQKIRSLANDVAIVQYASPDRS